MTRPSSSAESQRLDAMLRLVAEAVLATDPQGVITLINPAAEKLFSLEAEQAVGWPLSTVNGLLGEWLNQAVQEARSEPWVFELKFDEAHYFSASLAPYPGEGGQYAGWLIVLQDVTHLKKLEQWKSEAIQTAAHDLRNPLNLIRGSVNLLQDLLLDPTPVQQECLDRIRAGTERMGALIEALLNLEYVGGGSDIALSKLNLDQVAQKVVEEFKLAAAEKGLQLAFEGASTSAKVLGDEAWLHRAAANLLSNAIKYTPRGGRVQVRYREAEAQGIVEVTDDGPGIPQAAQARLFERFYRVRGEATRGAPGTGLGLAIVKAIVEKHAGRVWVSSEEGKGSTFGFSVPLVQ